MGYAVRKIELYSMDDNKTYNITLPECDAGMLQKFENVITCMRNLKMDSFIQNNLKNVNIVFASQHVTGV